MKMATHTPGPWVAVEGAAHAKTTIKAGDIVVAECSGHGRYTSESLADARLIAAAPEMLSALTEILEIAEQDEDVVDGPEGPVADPVMRIAMIAREALRQVPEKANAPL